MLLPTVLPLLPLLTLTLPTTAHPAPPTSPNPPTLHNHRSTTFSPTKRQEQPWNFTCGRSTNGSPSASEITQAADALARYLEGVASSGRRCGLDNSRDYFNMITMGGWEANLYLTGRVKGLVGAEFDCNDMAFEIRRIADVCNGGGSGTVIGYEWILNCKALAIKGNVQQPYVEGGTGIEFRRSGVASGAHKG